MFSLNPEGNQFLIVKGLFIAELNSKFNFYISEELNSVHLFDRSETRCEIHDSFDLYDGRKPVGGKVGIFVDRLTEWLID